MSEPRICSDCGATWQPDWPARECWSSKCEAAREERWRQISIREFKEVAPSLFHDTDPKRMPKQAQTEFALRWRPDYRQHRSGLLLIGKPRTGKSRTAYLVGLKMATECAEVGWWRGSNMDAEEFRDFPGVAIVDDIDKGIERRTARALYDGIDDRLCSDQPTVITTNATRKQLSYLLGSVLGPPLVARLDEHYVVVDFNRAG